MRGMRRIMSGAIGDPNDMPASAILFAADVCRRPMLQELLRIPDQKLTALVADSSLGPARHSVPLPTQPADDSEAKGESR